MQVESWPIDRPIPYARNPRKIDDRAVSAVAGSIREFGFRQPIVVDEQGTIIVGHTRLLAARKLGLTEVPVHVATGLTPEQVKAYRLADNRVGEFTDWDSELLGLELGEIDLDLSFCDFDEIATTPDFKPAAEEDQGQLDKIQPQLVKCPSCGCIHDARETRHEA